MSQTPEPQTREVDAIVQTSPDAVPVASRDAMPYAVRDVSSDASDAARHALNAVRAEVAKAVVGQDAAVAGLLVALLCRGHILLEGVPGVAKTLLVRSAGRRARRRDQAGPVHPRPDAGRPHRLAGLRRRARATSPSAPGPVFTNLLLADEINRTPPEDPVGAARGDGGAAGQRRRPAAPAARAVHGRRHPEPRRVRRHLPAARGPARPVPAQGDAAAAAARRRGRRAAPARDRVRPARPGRRRAPAGRRGRPTSRPAPTAVRTVEISDEVAAYIVDIARATRSSPSLALGVSPRGATALMATSRAWAWLTGRGFVTPDDVKALAHATLAHRLSLRPEAELEGVSVDAVLDSALGSVPVPR